MADTLLHLLVADDREKPAMTIGGRHFKQLCNPKRPYNYEAKGKEQATGDPDACNCRACLALWEDLKKEQQQADGVLGDDEIEAMIVQDDEDFDPSASASPAIE